MTNTTISVSRQGDGWAVDVLGGGSLFPDKGEQPTVFFFTEKMVGPEVEEAFAAVAFELFGKRFTIEEAKEYSLTGKPVTINKRTAIFQSMPF